MLRGLNKHRLTYNNAVALWLHKHARQHWEALSATGIKRGWWDQINYFRTTYKSVEACGQSIAALPL